MNFNDMLQQAQAIAQRAVALQEELARHEVEAQAGGGVVTARANGARQLVAIRIDPEAVRQGDVQMLEDLVLAAANAALEKAGQRVADEMKKVTGGLGIPGLG
jgi:hypothetical protein